MSSPAPSAIDPISVVPAGPEHATSLSLLFDRAGTPCHCRYWHFRGDTNAWLARCALEPGVNASEMTTSLAAGSPEMRGVVAVDPEGRVVGWLKVAPAATLSKLYEQRVYRHLSCFDGPREGVHAVSCLLVDPALRGRGLARSLLRAAIRLARAGGATAIEAFPRRGIPLRDDELGTGPYSVFAAEGFAIVHDFAPYPVLRLQFRAARP